jgi:hypothetical protein
MLPSPPNVKVEITKERDARKPKGSAFFNAHSRSKDTSFLYFLSYSVKHPT